MAEYAYNNAKNASTGYTPFELHCGINPWVLFEKDINPCSKSRSTNKLTKVLKEWIEIYC